jgi:hypothetical protein
MTEDRRSMFRPNTACAATRGPRERRRGIARAMLVLASLGVGACAPIARFQTSGELAGQPVATRVDSRVAAYYLESYLVGQRDDAEMTEVIEDTLEDLDPVPRDREGLEQLADELSADFATMHFVSRAYAQPRNRRLQDRYTALVEELSDGSFAPTAEDDARYKSYTMVFVPGYAYRSNPSNGASFTRQRTLLTELGFEPEFIETEELGYVEANAELVTRTLRDLAAAHERIVVVSTSKGGTETAMALSALDGGPAMSSIKAWISVGGLLRGSPYADRYLSGVRRWLAGIMLRRQGQPPDILENLSTEVRRASFAALELPSEVLMLHYVAAPLSGQVPEGTQGRYKILRRQGPNDGLTLLADELVEGGLVVTEVGLDHYFRAPDIDVRTVALTYAVLDELERLQAAPQQAGASPMLSRDAGSRSPAGFASETE